MKSKLSLKSLAKSGQFFSLGLLLFITSGCTSSTTPTFLKENITSAIQDIAKNEYKIDVRAKLVGKTLWVYLPLEDLLEKSDKPEKYLEKFDIQNNKAEFEAGLLKLKYLIKNIPEKEKFQEYKYSKQALEKIDSIWKVLRRVIFSMDSLQKNNPIFFCLVTADIKNGIETKEIFYYLDLKKVSYDFISWGEYQHRTIQETDVDPRIIGDKEGLYLEYKDITLDEFVADQIQHRIKLKFQRPEVTETADIDKEILKVAIFTIKTYMPEKLTAVELDNLLTKNKIILNRAAILARPIE